MEYYVKDQKLCKKCKYSMCTSSVRSARMCGYILRTGNSRVYDDRQRTVEKGYCNKYNEREEYE